MNLWDLYFSFLQVPSSFSFLVRFSTYFLQLSSASFSFLELASASSGFLQLPSSSIPSASVRLPLASFFFIVCSFNVSCYGSSAPSTLGEGCANPPPRIPVSCHHTWVRVGTKPPDSVGVSCHLAPTTSVAFIDDKCVILLEFKTVVSANFEHTCTGFMRLVNQSSHG